MLDIYVLPSAYPYVLNQIILQLLMHCRISNLLTHGNEGRLDWRHLVTRIGKRSMSVVWLVLLDQTHWVLPLILNDYVVQDHTTVYHFPHLIFQPGHSRK